MSIAMLNYVFERSTVRRSARLVLLALADRADDSGRCWPSIEDTARRVGLSDRQTQKVISSLIEKGELRIIRSGGGCDRNGRGLTNWYLLAAERSRAELDAITAPEPCRPRQGTRRSKGVAGDREPCRSRPATLSPATTNPVTGDRGTTSEPPVQPSIEPPGRSASFASSKPRTDAAVRPHGGPSLGKAIDGCAGAAGQDCRRRNPGSTHSRIVMLLGDRGCDESFRQYLGRYGDLRLVQRVVAELDAAEGPIANPGGYVRKRLRDYGMKGI